MKIIFAGTPDFAAQHLQALIHHGQHHIVAVYTQPDRRAGRGKKLLASAVKSLANQYDLPVFQPCSFKDTQQLDILASHHADIMLVVAYGLLLPQTVLDIPRYGCVNVHGSILPRWRGAAPIQRAIEAGDVETGVSIMQMDVGLDTGPVISTAHCALNQHETSASLYQKLADIGRVTLLQVLEKIATDTAVAIPQYNEYSTYATKIDKSEALVNWSEPADALERRIRAFNPFPAMYSTIAGHRVKLWSASVQPSPEQSAVVTDNPGQIIRADNWGLLIECGDGCLLLEEIQLAGKSKMPVGEILKSRAELFAVGSRFDR